MKKCITLLPFTLTLSCMLITNSSHSMIPACGPHGDINTVADLINDGVNVNRQDNARRTQLMHAARCGDADSVQLLIAAGADCDAQDDEGNTALAHAVIGNHIIAVIDLLLTAHANQLIQNYDGETPLMIAARLNNIAIVRVLVRAALVEHRTRIKQVAAAWQDIPLDALDQCISPHINPLNIHDNNGRTAAMHAACAGCDGAVALLVQAGADTTITDNNEKNIHQLVATAHLSQAQKDAVIQALTNPQAQIQHQFPCQDSSAKKRKTLPHDEQ